MYFICEWPGLKKFFLVSKMTCLSEVELWDILFCFCILLILFSYFITGFIFYLFMLLFYLIF